MLEELEILARMALAVVVAILATIGRRLFRGPLVASWSWSTEFTVVSLRAGISAALADPDVAALRRLEGRMDPRLPRPLRRTVAVERIALGGRPAERLTRTGSAARAGDVLYFHGGGYVGGSPASHRRFVASLVATTTARAWVPDYRLAPEHPYPGAVDDASAAYRSLLDMGVEPERLLLGGDSAGGGLSIALLLRLRREGVSLPAGAVLFSPYVDLAHTGSSPARNARTDYLPAFEPGRPNDTYLGDVDPRTPEASPLYGDLSGLPPLLIVAGDREAILDDSIRLFDRAIAHGVPATLHLGEDMPHVHPAVLPGHPASREALARVKSWVSGVLV